MQNILLRMSLVVLGFWMPYAWAQTRTHAHTGLWSTVTTITEGHGPHHLIIFFDPNCPYCHKLYTELQPLIEPDRLTIGWAPVGILTLSSFGKAAALLEAPKPLIALIHGEQSYDTRGRGMAITPRRATAVVKKALDTNAQLLNRLGGLGVPFTVYRLRHDEYRGVTGEPRQATLQQWLHRLSRHIKPQLKRVGP